MTCHVLKTDPELFDASWEEEKPFEVRLDDRNFTIEDTLVLLETTKTGEEIKAGQLLEFTGRVLQVHVMYKLMGTQYGLKPGWCIMGTALEIADELNPEEPSFRAFLEGIC